MPLRTIAEIVAILIVVILAIRFFQVACLSGMLGAMSSVVEVLSAELEAIIL